MEREALWSERMKKPAVQRVQYLLPLLIALLLPIIYHVVSRPFGPGIYLGLDDGYIHATLARNLARTGILGINPGEGGGGSSSLIWTTLLTLPALLHIPTDLTALLLGIATNVLAVFAVWKVSRLFLSDRLALVAAFLAALSGQSAALALTGMESMLAPALVMLGFAANRNNKKARYFFFTLAALTRIETLLTPVILVTVEYFDRQNQQQTKSLKSTFLPLAWVVGIALAGLGVLALLGHGMPSTFLGRRWLYGLGEQIFSLPIPFVPFTRYSLQSNVVRLAAFVGPGGPLRYLWAGAILFLIYFGIVGIWMRRSRGRVLTIYLILQALFALYVIGSEGHIGRYLAFFWLLLPLFTIVGWQAIGITLRGLPKTIYLYGSAVLLLIGYIPQLGHWSTWHAQSIQHLATVHATMAEDVDELVPEGETVAAFDIGLLSFRSTHRIFDLGGLTGKETVHAMYHGIVPKLMKAKDIKYIVLPEVKPQSYERIAGNLRIDPSRYKLLSMRKLPPVDPDYLNATRIAMPILSLLDLSTPNLDING